MPKTITPALLSQEQMELLIKEYRFKRWEEKDLPVLENLILSCGGQYKLSFIKSYLSWLNSQILLSRDFGVSFIRGKNGEVSEECRIEQQNYKQILTNIVGMIADDKTNIGQYLDGGYFFPSVLNEIAGCQRNLLLDDRNIIIEGEEITHDDLMNVISLYTRFDYSFNYQSRKEFVDSIKFAKIRNILKTLSDREKQQYFIDCFVLGFFISKNRMEEINQLMASLKSKNESEYQDAINVLKKDLYRLAKGKSFADKEEKNSYINGTKYRFLISYILSNGQEDVWFNDYAHLVFQTKEDLEFLEEYGNIFNLLGWAERLISMLSENLKQNWTGAFIMQLKSLDSAIIDLNDKESLRGGGGWTFKRGDTDKYSLLNVTEADISKLLSLIDTSAPVAKLKGVFEAIRKDEGYVAFINALQFSKSDEYKRLILEGKVNSPYELLSIVESLNFDDIEHISDNLFISLSGEEVKELAHGIGRTLKHLKKENDKKYKESKSEIDDEMALDDLRALEEVHMILKDKLISGFQQVRQKLEAGWFKRWLMGGEYREQLNDLNNKFTGFTVVLPPKILEQVFFNQNYNSQPK